MYGSSVPTNVTAGLPGAAPAAAAGWGVTQSLWMALLVVTLLTVGMALWRLVPRPQR